jgi:hypothetical protein
MRTSWSRIAMRIRLSTTLLVIVNSLRPAGRRAPWAGTASGQAPSGYTPVPPEAIPLYLAGLNSAVGSDGNLALFFPGCSAVAAPFLLFRLKREGYSGCRAIATDDGLLVDATR